MSKLITCSVPIKGIRIILYNGVLTWLNHVVRVVVHTFVVDENGLPLDADNPSGYWYCAGDFCDIDEAGVTQHLSNANLDFAKCLVAPNIKDDGDDRPIKVIAGTYNINYVCYNITNRILYATDKSLTLADLDLPITGYALVVKSVLGVYGQNKMEWSMRKESCDLLRDGKDTDPQDDFDRSREDEILKIHLRASGGNYPKAIRLTQALDTIDFNFLVKTTYLVTAYDKHEIDIQSFNNSMLTETASLFSKTMKEVGLAMTHKIYPECKIGEIIKEYGDLDKPSGLTMTA